MTTSFISRTRFFLGILHTILLAMVALFIWSAWSTASEKMTAGTANLLQVYGSELDQKLNGANLLLQRIMFNNAAYDQLQSADETQRVYASLALKKFIDDSLLFDTDVDMVVVAESTWNTCIDQSNVTMTLFLREALRNVTRDCARTGAVRSQWKYGEFAGEPFLYRVHTWNGYATAIFMQLNRFMGTGQQDDGFEDTSLGLRDEAGTAIWGDVTGTGSISLQEYAIDNGRFTLVAATHMAGLVKQIRSHVLWLLALMLVSLFFSFRFGRQLQSDILNPMVDMQQSMEQIVAGDVEHRITSTYTSLEFSLLKKAFNSLMNQIVGLKIAGYEKQLQLQDSELKVVRLQIKPHFFLNALTTISSLSQQGKNDLIVTYISALSKNIRYMFRSGLHTVTLADEITHVENYFEMQDLKYPGSVFHFIDMEPEAAEWKIPQMLIHTIIENEYKYALQPEGVLTILIRAGLKDVDGKPHLLIEIEDDGEGYPDSVLEEFRSHDAPQDGHRLGLWSIRRMLELMYEEQNLFTIANNTVQGCMNRFLIPAEPRQENAREDKWYL